MRRILWCLLVATACGGALGPVGEGLPTITHYDTRSLGLILFADSVRHQLVALYQEAQHETLETAACLYGFMKKRNVFVDRIVRGDIAARQPHAVFFNSPSGCAEEAGLVGQFHTHLVHPEGVMQRASIMDMNSFWGDTRLLALFVGVGPFPQDTSKLLVYWTLRHGNFGYMVWP